jgi:hypothetical protein
MTEQDATLQDVWRMLGSLNRRMGERFDVVERQLVALDGRISALDARLGAVDARVTGGFGALKESIEARDFRLDEHGRRLTKIEESLP